MVDFERLERYLGPGERLGGWKGFTNLGEEWSLVVTEVLKPGRPVNDRVFLEIMGANKPNKLIGGNPLQIDVLSGFGRLAVVNMTTREHDSVFLEAGKSTVIFPGEAYWYENLSEEPLILRDTCEGFDPMNEPEIEMAELIKPRPQE